MTRRRIVVGVLGPTASGKSALAVALARTLDGEVVNADAMSVYRGMDIGTAKPTELERGGVPHHLFDVWDVRHAVSVAEYQERARAVIDDVLARSRTPVLVGGSGLYVAAALDDLAFPPTDPAVRAALDAELAATGAPAMHARLAAVDPAAAGRILPGNGRRIVRALEVVQITGRPYAAVLPEPVPHYPAVLLGLAYELAVLDRRIAERTRAMFRHGFVAEVEGLAAAGLREGLTASRAVGYRQVLDMLEAAAPDRAAAEEAALAATERATRRLARRQRSWLRRDHRIHWLQPDGDDVLARALSVVRPTIER